MTQPDLDTFLVALYTFVDDLYQAHFAPHKPPRSGPTPTMSDSEVLALLVVAQGGRRSQRAFLRHVRHAWRPYFPRLLSQSAFHRRAADLTGVLVHLVPLVAEELRAFASTYQAVDTMPLPLMKRCRGERRRLFGWEAGFGRGGSDKDWYYGCKLLMAATREGVITGFLLAPASTEDRWVADAFFCWRSLPPPMSRPPPTASRGGMWGRRGRGSRGRGAGVRRPGPT